MNSFKWAVLMAALIGLFMGVGYLVGNNNGMFIAAGIAFLINFISYWFSDKIVLGMYRARPVSRGEAPGLNAMIDRLSRNAGIPAPRLYSVRNPTPNAFATGRNPANSAVAVTTGLLNLLDDSELEGVLAHEISHIKNRDTLIGTIAATLAGAITLIARMAYWGAVLGGRGGGDNDRDGGALGALVLMIVAPLAAMLIQFAISRSREYSADASGARISGNPLGLAHALRKLEAGVQRVPMQSAEPATAHMFIVNPFRGGGIVNLFSTHPPIRARVARLEQMAHTSQS